MKKKQIIGLDELKRYQKGEALTADETVLARCCFCQYEYEDGKIDCRIKDCPLHPFMPYKGRKST